MTIKKQRFIAYILALLVAFVIPQIASADDPCKDFNDTVTKFVSEIPRLSSSELTVGRFDVENNKISYLVNGNKIFKKEWHDSCDPSDEFCKAQITPILGLGGYGGLHIAQQARHFALTCDHLIFPSSTTNSFKSVSKPWSITVKDLDNDNVSEIISHELQQWALDCDLCLACIDATAWNNIYHFSSEGNLIPVNEHFPQRYAELLTYYKMQYNNLKQDPRSYANACNPEQLNNQFQALINRAKKLSMTDKAPQSITEGGLHITTTALGRSWQDQDVINLYVPYSDFEPLGVKVKFVATSQNLLTLTAIGETIPKPMATGSFDFIWQVDGGEQIHNASFSPTLMSRDAAYIVKLCAIDKILSSNTSTLSSTQSCKYSSQVKVTVKKNENWNCLGRMGSNCGDDNIHTNFVRACGPSTLSIPEIQQIDNIFYIKALASVGSIKHDLCCKNHNEVGFMCNGEPKEKNCELEWAHSMLDWKLQDEFSKMDGIKAVTLFDHKWKYIFEKISNGSTSIATEWWKGMLPDGDVVIGYDVVGDYRQGSQYISGDEIEGTSLCSGEHDVFMLGSPILVFVPILGVPFYDKLQCSYYFPRNSFPSGLSIQTVHVCKNTQGLLKTLVNPQGKIDTVGNKIAPRAKSKAKEARTAECNKGSNDLSSSIGGAQGALKKYGTGTDGCAQ